MGVVDLVGHKYRLALTSGNPAFGEGAQRDPGVNPTKDYLQYPEALKVGDRLVK